MMGFNRWFELIVLCTFITMGGISACSIQETTHVPSLTELPISTTAVPVLEMTQASITVTPVPSRPSYTPGELVDYVAQTGDTLPVLAIHFNTSVEEILAANTFIPEDATTMPPGMPMKIPIYYAPFWDSPYQIIPDDLFINGPAQIGFDSAEFIANKPGWLNGYAEYAFYGTHTAAEIVDYVSLQYSVSPRLLLALIEYQAGGLSQPSLPPDGVTYVLGNVDWQKKGLYRQLVWAADTLNNGYYSWRAGSPETFDTLDGRLIRPDPWQNAASVALQYYFSRLFDGDLYAHSIAHDGVAQTYKELFGDPWQNVEPHIPGSLAQPEFRLPFYAGLEWAYTGGPHSAYGSGAPLAALDFAPGAMKSGCTPTHAMAVAVASGVIARSETGLVMLALDGDGDERTGWVVLYLHVATEGRASLGKVINTGDPVGYPSCEGGIATGTHLHIARKYNGEWILADSVLAFNLGGWIAHNGDTEYQGTLSRNTKVITACECSDAGSQIIADER